MTHDLKVWPEFFKDLVSKKKQFEVRKDDRNFQVGDYLVLKEWIPEISAYSGKAIYRIVIYKLGGGSWGIEKGYCVLGLGVRE